MSTSKYALLGDLGGTNLRLFLVDLRAEETTSSRISSETPTPLRSQRLSTKELQLKSDGDASKALLPALVEFLGEDAVKICVLSVNGPVDKGNVTICGQKGWRFSEAMIADALMLPVNCVKLVNDFMTVGHALPHIHSRHIRCLYDPTLTSPDAVTPQIVAECSSSSQDVESYSHPISESNNLTIACLGPGTGLGAVFLTYNDQESCYRVNASESGMANFTATTQLQWQLRQFCRAQQSPEDDHVIVERIVSGEGFLLIYQFLRQEKRADFLECIDCELDDAILMNKESAYLITSNVDTCALCAATVDLFLQLMGQELGDFAMRVRPLGGMYLAGGIVGKLWHLLLRGNLLVQAYLNKGDASPCVSDIPLLACIQQGDDLTLDGLWHVATGLFGESST